ncbi:hypothetical protein B0J13DRAFT_526032 [Dactylonectria estremocensis]|uniref:Uncharacterized protein n=1 Tax=Dactylonectria estremocensis TaxID=1079267 RepID=A0A9P9ES63_9HYPO|nr:hypothetical protein B0J13DRAFT_526032 [Dactylonectria estremocensis]
MQGQLQQMIEPDVTFRGLQESVICAIAWAQLRQAMQEFGVPVIYLIATLKKSQEKALFNALRFIPECIQIFQKPTTQPNIQYRVEIVKDADEGGQEGKRKKGKAKAKVKVNGEGEEEGEEDDAVMERMCEII